MLWPSTKQPLAKGPCTSLLCDSMKECTHMECPYTCGTQNYKQCWNEWLPHKHPSCFITCLRRRTSNGLDNGFLPQKVKCILCHLHPENHWNYTAWTLNFMVHLSLPTSSMAHTTLVTETGSLQLFPSLQSCIVFLLLTKDYICKGPNSGQHYFTLIPSELAVAVR